MADDVSDKVVEIGLNVSTFTLGNVVLACPVQEAARAQRNPMAIHAWLLARVLRRFAALMAQWHRTQRLVTRSIPNTDHW